MKRALFKHSYWEERCGLVYANDSGGFDVYEIPQYGGVEQFEKAFDNYDEAVAYSKSFT